jgi:DNA-directed RNA polymerase specialized sigma24 family protein
VAAANWDLLEAHRHALTAFLGGKCPSQGDVEDCVQEAMLRVAQLPDVDPPRLRGLLKTIAYNVAMDMHRERRRQSAAFARVGTPLPAAADALAVDSCEARRLAVHARRLSFKERAALLGRANGFAPSETAALLGDTPKSVHLALSRARTSLRRLAETAGAMVLWLRRHGRGSLRLAAPSIVAMTVGLALLTPRLDGPWGNSPPAGAPPAVAGVGWHAAPTVARPRPARSASAPMRRVVTARVTAVTGASSDRRTMLYAHAGSRQVVDASAGVVEVNPNQPLLTGIEACLAPGAIWLDRHHAGCAG